MGAEKMRAARKARKEREAKSLDGVEIDPQAAELGGGGLKSKVISEEEIELSWATDNEADNKGYIVQRRPGGTNDFENIASFESFAPLRSKGVAGGSYKYLDDSVPSTGTWVYRVVDKDSQGKMTAIAQKLVEVESASEQTGTLVIGAAIFGLAAVLFVAGVLYDPMQTTTVKGGGFSKVVRRVSQGCRGNERRNQSMRF